MQQNVSKNGLAQFFNEAENAIKGTANNNQDKIAELENTIANKDQTIQQLEEELASTRQELEQASNKNIILVGNINGTAYTLSGAKEYKELVLVQHLSSTTSTSGSYSPSISGENVTNLIGFSRYGIGGIYCARIIPTSDTVRYTASTSEFNWNKVCIFGIK